MQVTVTRYDEQTGDGAAVTDDGARWPVPADAVARAGLRRLRAGQRLEADVEDEVIVAVAIPGDRSPG